jgi:hypothetical protein
VSATIGNSDNSTEKQLEKIIQHNIDVAAIINTEAHTLKNWT